MGSEAMGETIWFGKTGMGSVAGTLTGKAPGIVAPDPLTMGAPRAPGRLQQ